MRKTILAVLLLVTLFGTGCMQSPAPFLPDGVEREGNVYMVDGQTWLTATLLPPQGRSPHPFLRLERGERTVLVELSATRGDAYDQLIVRHGGRTYEYWREK